MKDQVFFSKRLANFDWLSIVVAEAVFATLCFLNHIRSFTIPGIWTTKPHFIPSRVFVLVFAIIVHAGTFSVIGERKYRIFGAVVCISSGLFETDFALPNLSLDMLILVLELIEIVFLESTVSLARIPIWKEQMEEEAMERD